MSAFVAPPDSPAKHVRPSARWLQPAEADARGVGLLETELRLPALICGLLSARGHREPEAAKRFLRPRLDQLHSPDSMLGLRPAVERLARAVRSGETILVHGDYDVDGICSTTLLTAAIRAFGGRALPFTPHRLTDGYDLTMAGVRAAIAASAKVVVTCDCGTNAIEPVAALCRAGIDVIVSDHHLPSGPLPDCLAVLNPKQDGCEYPDKDLAAVGVAFKLMIALAAELGVSETPVLRMLDLVALATIADIAPLRGENRVFARYGLRLMQETTNPGLRALIRSSGLAGKPLTAGRVGFILAPRLNAVGRLGHAIRGVELLMATTEHEANGIARELEELNRQRQEVDRATLAEARSMLDGVDLDQTYGIVLAREGWHPGVIGIVASRLVEDTARPVVMIALNNGEGKGSGRSIPAFDLHAGLSECRDLLLRFGGHRAAAGVTIAEAELPAFAARFNDIARERLTPEDLVPEIRVDIELSLAEANDDLDRLLRHFEPFGMGNPSPVLVVRGVHLSGDARIVGQDGLKLCLTDGGVRLDAIGWGMGARAAELRSGDAVDVAFRLERDEWNGEPRLQAKLADIRRR